MKTMNEKDRQISSRDDSSSIEKKIESDKNRISEITENLNKDRVKRK